MKVRTRSTPQRCSYCHGAPGDEPLCECAGTHQACVKENKSCPACGVSYKAEPTPQIQYEECWKFDTHRQTWTSTHNRLRNPPEMANNRHWPCGWDPGTKKVLAGGCARTLQHIGLCSKACVQRTIAEAERKRLQLSGGEWGKVCQFALVFVLTILVCCFLTLWFGALARTP